MSRTTLIALLLGLLLVAAPIVRASEDGEGGEDYADEHDEDEDGEEEAATGSADEKDVLVLTTKNFDETIKKHRFVLAEFYAPWCGHCKSLAPQYAKAATALKAHDADVVLAKIDATAETELGTKFEVKGYPTLKWFVDGEPTDYNGPRDADGIVAWVKKKSGPPAILVEDVEKLKALEGESGTVIVGFFSKLKGKDYDTFKAVATKIEDVTFVETTVKAVGAVAGLTAPGIAAIKNHKDEERATVKYGGEVDAEDLTTWVRGEKLPLTIEFNEGNSDTIFNSGIKQQLLLVGKEDEIKAGSDAHNAYRKAAEKYKGQLVFVTVNTEGPSAEPVVNFFGLKDSSTPLVVGFFMDKNKKYRMQEPVNEAAIKAFAQGVLDGTAHVEYKSQPVPENPKDGEVVIVVGKTVDEIVFAEDKDVLLEVYAPWCGHCKQLEPIYKKLAKRFKNVDSVVIAKMDGTENEHGEIDVKGFPTLLFKPAGKDRKLTNYDEGDRSLKALTKFIKSHAKIPYTLPKKEKGEKEEEKEEAKPAKDEL